METETLRKAGYTLASDEPLTQIRAQEWGRDLASFFELNPDDIQIVEFNNLRYDVYVKMGK
jgi:hypothetical protein